MDSVIELIKNILELVMRRILEFMIGLYEVGMKKRHKS